MKLIRKILFPVVPFYYLVTWLRNICYDLGVKKSASYHFPVLCVGNLSVGGTGKTPMIEYLIKLLKDDFKVATLSRGYKRKTKGFKLADGNATAETIGDEPFQFYHKFGNDVWVAVDSDRRNGIKNLRHLKDKPEIILLDDAFQHRRVKAGFNILLTTYANPYYSDFVLPTGNLREPKSGAKRAHVVVVTKCPKHLKVSEKNSILNRIKAESYQHVFFSSIVYSNEVFSKDASKILETLTNFTLVTGIANAEPLVDFLNSKNLKFQHLNYNDHYQFSPQDILYLEKQSLIITTEKDYMRLRQHGQLNGKLFYLPITIVLDREHDFKKLIEQAVKH
ncbi:tetraacyldisaccharide 4'-kinase [Gelatiniphilus marinus]|uniref:Tetraacyldisaccharide 4'-kinase n=1 Tax=Gelatiniphilus marinus TaxID=1759464 RepID=A0ABW5JQU2_9FLAO